MDSGHPLLTWITANTTQAQFARDLGFSESHLSDILNGKKRPSLALAARMSAATGAEVSIEAFVKIQPAEAAE